MKIAILGDVHIGASHGLGKKNKDGSNSRSEDYKSTLDWVANYCFDNSIDVLVQTGDLFEKRSPSRHDFDIAESFLKKMSAYGITTMVIMGNHDYIRTGISHTSALKNLSIDGLPEVSIYLTPDCVQFVNPMGERANLVLMPFRDKRMFEGKSLQEKTYNFNQEILSFINKSDGKSPTIFVGHNFIFEGSYNDFGATEVFAKRDTFHGISAAFMGHYHNSKTFSDQENNRVFYTGSMEKNNFGDRKNDKFLFIYDTKLDKVEKVKMPVRDLMEFNVNLVDSQLEDVYVSLNDQLSKLDFNDKIVRGVFKVKSAHSNLLHKDKIEEKIVKKGAHFVSKITIDAVEEQLVRDLSPLRQEDDFSVLLEYLKMQGNSEERLTTLMKKAKEIMEEL